MTLPDRILSALAAHPDLSATEIATVLDGHPRSGVTGCLAVLTARGRVLRIKRPNENARTAYAYSLAPASRITPVPAPAPVVVIDEPRVTPAPKPDRRYDMDQVIAVVLSEKDQFVAQFLVKERT